MSVNRRQANTCNPGYSFYVCNTGFKGCCSRDACSDPVGCDPSERDPIETDAAEATSRGGSSTAEDYSKISLHVNTPIRTVASTSTPAASSSSPTQAASLTSSEDPTGGGLPPAVATGRNTSEDGGTPSSTSSSRTPIIVGVVVGVVVAAIAIWLVWVVVKRRRKRIRDEATKPEREQWSQGPPDTGHGLGISSGHNAHDEAPHSPWSYMYSPKQDESVPSSESSPNNGGIFPSPIVPSELSAEPSPKAELSPNPETLEINKARYPSGVSRPDTPSTYSNPSPRHPPGGPEMRSNLEVSDEEDRRRGSHVMSWMSYGSGAAGPAGSGA
ncbi:MAG: hypothetical protein Q9168_004322 [Polycauliona sp. 1 TL-2023]